MAKAKKTKVTKRGKNAWARFMQDNGAAAKDKANATEDDTHWITVLGEWWKEVSQEVKDNYEDKTYKYEVGADKTAVTKKATKKSKAEAKKEAEAEKEAEKETEEAKNGEDDAEE